MSLESDNPTRRSQEVWQACDSLYEEGYNVREITGKAVSERLVELGCKEGNPNYRYKYINTWLQHHGLSKQVSLAEPSQKKSIDAITRGAELFKKGIEEAIKEEYEEKRQQAEQKVTEANNKLQQKIVEFEKQTDLYEKLLADFSALKREHQESLGQISTLNKDKGYIEAQLAEQEKAYREFKYEANNHHQDYKKRTESVIEELRTDLVKEAKLKREEVNAVRDLAEKQRHIHIVEIENLKSTINKLEKKLGKAEAIESKVQSDNKELKEKVKRLEKELTHAAKGYNVQLQKEHELGKELFAVQRELKQLQVLSSDYKQEGMQAQTEIIKHKEQIVRLEEAIKQLKNRKLAGKSKK